jgi:hypothetical protein
MSKGYPQAEVGRLVLVNPDRDDDCVDATDPADRYDVSKELAS